MFSIKKAQTTLEFILLMSALLAAFLVFQKYIVRAVNGRWKQAGDSFAGGQLYDPGFTEKTRIYGVSTEKTTECSYDYVYTSSWYDKDCFKEQCDCISVEATSATCNACVISCATPECSSRN